MYWRHENLFRSEFRLITIPPREYRPTRTSLESRDSIDAAYLAGEKARQDRVPRSACPFSKDDPSSHNWQRGWKAARLAEVETPALNALLKRANLTVAPRAIQQLDSQHRFELADWLESAADPVAREINRPSWVQFDPQDAADDMPRIVTGPRRISFAIRSPLACPDDDDEANEPELPRLRELPPATREESLLQALLRQFDDLGVQLVEEQWQALCSADQDAAIDWLNDRLDDQASPIPASLYEFATTALKNEFVGAHDRRS